MISHLIVSRDKAQRTQYARNIIKELNIDELDITELDKETLERKDKKPALSIGIEDIRTLYTKVFLKPIKSPMKAVIVHDAHFLTLEAQNALLKLLEEPPAQTVLILTAHSKELLLPTIQSRCKLVELTYAESLPEKEVHEFKQILQLLQGITIPDALKLAETVSKDKEKAIVWLEKLILVTRQTMIAGITNGEKRHLHVSTALLHALQKTYTLLKTTNVNTRLAFEHLFLSQAV